MVYEYAFVQVLVKGWLWSEVADDRMANQTQPYCFCTCVYTVHVRELMVLVCMYVCVV